MEEARSGAEGRMIDARSGAEGRMIDARSGAEGRMIESFVDLSYRGLSLGRRVKLSQVRPSTGYLETPAPMPVGTAISIATDEGLTLEATVTSIHEQVGGSEKTPGMTVAPKLAGEASESWWRARVAYPDEAAATAPAVSRTSSKVTVRPRTHTTQEPIAEPAQIAHAPRADTVVDPVYPPEIADVTTLVAESKQTMIMPAVDQELLEQLTRKSGDIESPIEQIVGSSGEYEVVDDGKQTMMMDAIDPAALGLDMSSSGSFPVVDEDSGVVGGSADDKKSGGNGSKKKRKKR